nr:hypothetical protein CFP56_16851 [Quercus suber]
MKTTYDVAASVAAVDLTFEEETERRCCNGRTATTGAVQRVQVVKESIRQRSKGYLCLDAAKIRSSEWTDPEVSPP